MSTLNTTEALILRTYSLGEADKIVLFLTLKSGVLRGVAKGARRLKSRYGASLEPFTFINLTYRAKEDKELVILQQVEIQQAYFGVSSDPDALADWAYLGELIVALSPPHEPNPKLFALAKASMETLAQQPNERRAIRTYFSIWLLKLSGLLPSWSSCKLCQGGLKSAKVYFDGVYHLYCENCRPAPAQNMSAEMYNLLTATRTHSPPDFARLAKTTNALFDLDAMSQTLLGAAL